jgi:hypothetical protein
VNIFFFTDWKIVINNQVYLLNIDTSSKKISSNQYS